MILFKRKFHDAIRDGTKTQTIRFWTRRLVRPGDLHFSPGLGYLRVRSIAEACVEGLSEDDARADGFATLADLREELGRLYGDGLPPGRHCFRIAFEYVGKTKPE